MKFTCTVDINKDRKTVVQLFEDPNNLHEWQDGFIRMERVSGTPGAVNAKTRLLYKQDKGTMELIETLLVNNLPDEMIGEYWHKHMTNTMRVTFEELGSNETRYNAEIEYTEFRGFLPKLMGFLFPGMFKKQTLKWMQQFKAFVER